MACVLSSQPSFRRSSTGQAMNTRGRQVCGAFSRADDAWKSQHMPTLSKRIKLLKYSDKYGLSILQVLECERRSDTRQEGQEPAQSQERTQPPSSWRDQYHQWKKDQPQGRGQEQDTRQRPRSAPPNLNRNEPSSSMARPASWRDQYQVWKNGSPPRSTSSSSGPSHSRGDPCEPGPFSQGHAQPTVPPGGSRTHITSLDNPLTARPPSSASPRHTPSLLNAVPSKDGPSKPSLPPNKPSLPTLQHLAQIAAVRLGLQVNVEEVARRRQAIVEEIDAWHSQMWANVAAEASESDEGTTGTTSGGHQ